MSQTLFISDLHLSESRPDMTQAFLTFLQNKITKDCDALYILGDFFEFWIGDDDKNPFHDSLIKALKSTSTKVPVYFIHGNRDFLVGKKFAKACGMTLLPEQKVIDLYGRNTLIMHGDSLCTLDIDFMKFRRKSRSNWWQTMILMLPLFVRRRIAQKQRLRSQMAQNSKSDEIMDVTPFEVINQMALNEVDLLIHGHTHRPAIHILDENESLGERIVLGDWYNQGSYLICSDEGNELIALPFG
jgi:UDP-2,3-diacylglucosamine hydrolase